MYEFAEFKAGRRRQTNFTTIRYAAVEDVDNGWSSNEQ